MKSLASMIFESSPEEQLEKAMKAKWFRWEYEYTRYNPQTGERKETGEVFARTEKEAAKLASEQCERTRYGENYFVGLTGKKEPAKLDKDFVLKQEKILDRMGRPKGSKIIATKKY